MLLTVGVKNTDVEVVLVYETHKEFKDMWPEGFFDLYGSTADAPLVEPEELSYEKREKLE